ncbi:uracil-DNA glycosylase family protein [Nitrolancea hollandica]|uniref:Uracil-DNA glycosylase-like domain-containing protein n=1 Tax=Nitrolancea hollandica Lb TaxID=1129897 RepID=I4EHR5_9BACT|nr:uracil-DNA glycosylase family protein [Nitrolancea hollandica]CCF84227.1 conserved hypothetical protein [Nitrolancea hollandica Lb]
MTRLETRVDVLLEIVRCPNVRYCLANPDSGHPCAGIVLDQRSKTLEEYQVPEPWSGRLEQAPILFLSSNPSISMEEEYPRWSWSDDLITDFFTNRFGDGRKPWVRDGRYSLLRDGTHSGAVGFWSAVRQRARELLGVDNVRPGEDYALSEVVHCKSRQEQGVAAARDECAGRYLQRIIAQAGAKVVVCLGKTAAQAVRGAFGVPEDGRIAGPIQVGHRLRYFAFLPHPNARGVPKTFAKCLPGEELGQLQAFLAAESS